MRQSIQQSLDKRVDWHNYSLDKVILWNRSMEKVTTPAEISTELSNDRLGVVAQLMLDVLQKALDDTSTEHDCAYTRGSLAWGRIKNALLQLIRSRRHPWLSVKHAGNDLVIGVGPHAVRFFIDDHQHPRKMRVLHPTDGEMFQLELALPQVSDTSVDLWRFMVERALTEEDEHKVYFVGYNRTHEVVAQWAYSESVRTFVAVDNHIPNAVALPPIDLTPIFDEAVSDDSYETSRSNQGTNGPV
jgi:hypothetical protein